MTAPEHPSWCDLSLCDAVIGDEVQDYSGAHRSRRTAGVRGWSFDLMQVVDAKPTPVFLVVKSYGSKVGAVPVAEIAPGLLELLAKAGYTTPPGEECRLIAQGMVDGAEMLRCGSDYHDHSNGVVSCVACEAAVDIEKEAERIRAHGWEWPPSTEDGA